MPANGEFIVIEIVQICGGPATTLICIAVAAYLVVWEVKVANKDTKAKISRVEHNVDANHQQVLVGY